MARLFTSLVAYAAIATASPLFSRAVTSLNEEATAEAQQRDATATRAFSNVQIKTSDGKCLFVDKLSGDFRANLTPIQVGTCGATDGQGWDIITKGKHNDASGAMLIVSTLTQACANFDPRRAAGNQVLLFSCGGRADGGGAVTNSQLFGFSGGAGPLALQPQNQQGSCFTVKGNVLDVAACSSSDAGQAFTFGDAAGGSKGAVSSVAAGASTTVRPAPTFVGNNRTEAVKTATVRATTTKAGGMTDKPAVTTEKAGVAASSVPAAGNNNNSAAPTGNPTAAVPVSRAGGTLNPTAVAEAQAFDATAKRTFSNVEIRAPNGQCMFVDPTAGDFRENLIPIALVDCSGSPNEKWDVVESGKHNNSPGHALIVSSLTQGCISFDSRRAAGDTVTLFSCGGRADGGGETNADQLFPFIGQFSFAFTPSSQVNKTCILPGNAGRLDSGPCPTNGAQLFSVFP